MASKNPPKKLYVVTKQVTYATGTVLDGMLSEYKPGVPTHENRMRTLEKWAYLENNGLMYGSRIEKNGNGDWFLVGEKWQWTSNNHIKIPVYEKLEHPPTVWDNVPLTGFKLAGQGHKCWQVKDPRGLVFDITFDCLQELIDNVGIQKGGDIEVPCLWAGNRKLIAII